MHLPTTVAGSKEVKSLSLANTKFFPFSWLTVTPERHRMPEKTKIKTRCPYCKSTFSVSQQHVGKVAKCPASGCGEKFKVEVIPTDKANAHTLPPSKPSLEQLDNPYLADLPPESPPPTGLTLSKTYASHPGRLKVNWIRWIRFKPKWPLILGAVLLGCSALFVYTMGVLTGLLLFLVAAMCVLYWLRVSNHFQYGCANIAVVVSLDPVLIAVSTDLSTGEGDFPVIKIVEIAMTRSAGKLLEVGDLLPTVSLYASPPQGETRHWSTFIPVPADYVTSDPHQIARLLANFTDEDIATLHSQLQQVPTPYEPGLYLMWRETGKQLGRQPEYKLYD